MIPETVLNEVEIFTYAVTFGAICSFAYDNILVVRRIFRHRQIYCMVEDLLYWVLVTICGLIGTFSLTNGVLYWYFLFGAILGFLFYKASLSKIYIRFMSTIIQHIVVYIKKLLDIVFKPVKMLKNAIKSVLLKNEKYIKKFTIISKMWLTVCIKWFKIILCKHTGTDSGGESEGLSGDTVNGR